MIDGKTVVCGLIGDPVEHTLSPVIHNTLAQETGRNLVYVPFSKAIKNDKPINRDLLDTLRISSI